MASARMPKLDVPLARLRFGETRRRDAWWAQPLLTVLGLTLGFGYMTWAVFQPDHYWFGPYLSPAAAPELFGESPHSWFGAFPDWWPAFLPHAPGLLIIGVPATFRMTCYYYRGSYYKAFWADPPACSVGEPRSDYWGEHKLPLLIQNVHRYALYLAIVFWFLLASEVLLATRFEDPATHKTTFGLGVGTLVMALNVTMIALYTFGCHSFRHLVGGVLDLFSRAPARKRVYDCVTCLNKRHNLWAWCSLATVCLTDVYIRLCSMGVITDLRII
jgi:hypothetical protein